MGIFKFFTNEKQHQPNGFDAQQTNIATENGTSIIPENIFVERGDTIGDVGAVKPVIDPVVINNIDMLYKFSIEILNQKAMMMH